MDERWKRERFNLYPTGESMTIAVREPASMGGGTGMAMTSS